MRAQAFLRSLPAFIIATLLALVVADRLLADTSPGWVIAPLLLAGAGMVLMRHPHLLRDAVGLLLLALLLPLAGAAVHGHGFLVPLLGTLVLVTTAWWGRGARYHGPWRWLLALVRAPLALVRQLGADRRLLNACRRVHGRRLPGAGLLVWLLPFALGLGFSGLFGMANPVIGQWFSGLGEWLASWFDPEHLLPSPARLVLWWGVAVGAWVLLRVRPPRLMPVRSAIPTQESDRTGLVLRCLVVVNAVFVVQVGMDLAYLAGGLHLPEGMTYATYAHRGAGPLFVAALVSAALVLIAFRPGGVAGRSPWARRLVLSWLGQNVALTLAAAWRLWLYVDAYGLSTWRLGAAIWMGLVAIGLILIALRIAFARSNRWLIDGNVLVTLATLMWCCWLDVGGIVAWHNVHHCREAGGDGVAIDLTYLAGFGVEAAPALAWLAEHSRDRRVALDARALADERRGEAQRLLTDWRTWTWIRAQVAVLPEPLPTDPRIGR